MTGTDTVIPLINIDFRTFHDNQGPGLITLYRLLGKYTNLGGGGGGGGTLPTL